MARKILIVGGAGYVGSAAAAFLLDQGHDIWIVDDLSTGHRELALGSHFLRARAGSPEVAALLKSESFDCVMHFAARSIVSESFEKRAEYFQNNVQETQALLDAMAEAGVRRFVFSSTAAVFGAPGDELVLDESFPRKPVNPYGETKLEIERTLERHAADRGLGSISLRYFNAAGAEPKLRVGEWHDPETHLIPRVIQAGLSGWAIDIYGTDYPTQDGTCIRDYVHVWDLAQAHAAAVGKLMHAPKPRAEFYNLGSQSGFTVMEVVDACEKALGKKIMKRACPRRAGDPICLVADSTLARAALGYSPALGLEEIISSALAWERKRRERHARKAIFLDRDGTLNEDPGYLNDPAKVALLPTVGDALADLKAAGFLLVVVSNQSGVGRGLIDKEMLPKVNARVNELLYRAPIDHWELCLHHPDESCDCRKPKPKLVLDAARALNVDLSRSYMVGDKLSDIEAGYAAGCRKVALVRTGDGREVEAKLSQEPGLRKPDSVGDTLLEVSRFILQDSV